MCDPFGELSEVLRLGTSVTNGEQVLSGLNIVGQFLFYESGIFDVATVRVLYTLENPTGADITVQLEQFTDFGSDDDGQVDATSSGDTTVTEADRWFITSDDPDPLELNDPVNTTVLYGPEAGSLAPDLLQADTSDFEVSFDAVTVPAGETRYLISFAQLSSSQNDAISAVSLFDDNVSLGLTGALCDLSSDILANVANWSGLTGCDEIAGRVFADNDSDVDESTGRSAVLDLFLGDVFDVDAGYSVSELLDSDGDGDGIPDEFDDCPELAEHDANENGIDDCDMTAEADSLFVAARKATRALRRERRNTPARDAAQAAVDYVNANSSSIDLQDGRTEANLLDRVARAQRRTVRAADRRRSFNRLRRSAFQTWRSLINTF